MGLEIADITLLSVRLCSEILVGDGHAHSHQCQFLGVLACLVLCILFRIEEEYHLAPVGKCQDLRFFATGAKSCHGAGTKFPHVHNAFKNNDLVPCGKVPRVNRVLVMHQRLLDGAHLIALDAIDPGYVAALEGYQISIQVINGNDYAIAIIQSLKLIKRAGSENPISLNDIVRIQPAFQEVIAMIWQKGASRQCQGIGIFRCLLPDDGRAAAIAHSLRYNGVICAG